MKPRSWPVSVLLSFYRITENPIYAWECYKAAREAGVAIPEDVLKYLDGAARGALNIAENPPEPKRLPEALFKAMGFSSDGPGRGGSAFTHYTRDRIGLKADLDIAIETRRKIKSWGEGHEHDVYRAVGEKYKISASTVRRKYKDCLNRGFLG
jgi:hypothetical protein